MLTVTIFALTVDAGENKAGWSSSCDAHAIRYCNKKHKKSLASYKACITIERVCGTELFDIVYPKDATEDELWECNRKLIKLLRDNNILSAFIMYEHSYCELLAIVKDQWPKDK